MTLQEFMDKKGWKDAEAAEFFGLERSYLSKMRRGKLPPSFRAFCQIWIRSGFKIGLKDWLTPEYIEGERKIAKAKREAEKA